MSRTYRKTTIHRGHANWRSRHMARFDHRKAEFVKPYLVPMSLYEEVIETYETDYRWNCPKQLRTYVSQGTPHAIEELGPIITWFKVGWQTIARREPSKWYLVPPNETKTRTIRKYAGRNPEYEEHDWYERWQRQHLFDFVRKNDTGGRRGKTARLLDRRSKSRKARHEAKAFIKNYIQEDHVADDYDPYDFYDDCHGEDYFDVDDYAFDYYDDGYAFDYDPSWKTDLIDRNHNLRTITEDAGESLADILEAMIQKEKYLSGELNEPSE